MAIESEREDSGVASLVREEFAGLKRRLGITSDQDNLVGYLFVAPNVLVFSIFLLGPVLYAFYLSFTEYSILQQEATMHTWFSVTVMLPALPDLVFSIPGLDNYMQVLRPMPIQGSILAGEASLNTAVFSDPALNTWWYSLRTTFVYAIGTIPFQIYGGLAVALLLDKRVRAKKAYRAAYFMPVMLSGAASAVIWRWVLAEQGVLNAVLMRPLGLAHNWAGSTSTALGGVMLMAIWGGIGMNMVLFLAGLQNIPEELYDAARIDGTSGWQRFRHVTWPNLDNTNFFVIVMAVIGAFQVFGIALVFSNGGPYYATTTTALLIYQRAFEEGAMGVGAAMAFMLFLIIFVFSYWQYRYRKSQEVDY